MSPTLASDYSTHILARAINPVMDELSHDAARCLLRFQLSSYDRERVNLLAAKAREGSLTNEEGAELDDYERTSALLELIQSKARQSLKKAGRTS